MSSSLALQIADVNKVYGNGVKALDSVSLDIQPGMFGLLGHNGAGKSSLMNTLATLQLPDTGSIRLDGIDVLNDPSAARLMIGYLPQEFGVYPGVAAEELLDYMAQLKGISDPKKRRADVERLLHNVNLWDVRDRSVDTYSGGMRQRFGVAQALIGAPKLLIVDEPTAGLDPTERNRLYEILAGISRDCIVFLSTHIVDDVATLCEQMAILHRGEIAGTGTPDEFVDRLRGRIWETTATLEDKPRLQTELAVIATRIHQGRLKVIVEADQSPGKGFVPKEPNLEDAFFSVTHVKG